MLLVALPSVDDTVASRMKSALGAWLPEVVTTARNVAVPASSSTVTKDCCQEMVTGPWSSSAMVTARLALLPCRWGRDGVSYAKVSVTVSSPSLTVSFTMATSTFLVALYRAGSLPATCVKSLAANASDVVCSV